jgi:hypothetical protein
VSRWRGAGAPAEGVAVSPRERATGEESGAAARKKTERRLLDVRGGRAFGREIEWGGVCRSLGVWYWYGCEGPAGRIF